MERSLIGRLRIENTGEWGEFMNASYSIVNVEAIHLLTFFRVGTAGMMKLLCFEMFGLLI